MEDVKRVNSVAASNYKKETVLTLGDKLHGERTSMLRRRAESTLSLPGRKRQSWWRRFQDVQIHSDLSWVLVHGERNGEAGAHRKLPKADRGRQREAP